MSGKARDLRGPESRCGLSAWTSSLVVVLFAACSDGVRAEAPDDDHGASEALAGFDADASGSWQALVAHSPRITPATNWDGSLEGLKTLWYEDGAKKGEGRFAAGRKEDAWTFWYENGQKRWEGTYVRDLVHGLERSWYQNGTLCYEGTSVKGKRHGPFSAWYEDGQPWWKGEYQLGVRQGPFRYWHRDGSPDNKVSGVYEDGKRVRGLGSDLAASK